MNKQQWLICRTGWMGPAYMFNLISRFLWTAGFPLFDNSQFLIASPVRVGRTAEFTMHFVDFRGRKISRKFYLLRSCVKFPITSYIFYQFSVSREFRDLPTTRRAYFRSILHKLNNAWVVIFSIYLILKKIVLFENIFDRAPPRWSHSSASSNAKALRNHPCTISPSTSCEKFYLNFPRRFEHFSSFALVAYHSRAINAR